MAHGSLPPLAPFPPATVRNILQNEEWTACLDAWIALLELRLKIPKDEFQSLIPKDDSSRIFLASFFQEAAAGDGLGADAKLKTLRRLCFLLTRRQLLEVHPPPAELLDWEFLASFCRVYVSSPAMRTLLAQLWDQESQALTTRIEKGKALVMNDLSTSKAADGIARADTHLRSLTFLALAVPTAGLVLMTGSDYIDTLFDAYCNNRNMNATFNKTIVANAYVGFASLLKLEPPATSLLLDQLFSLKSSAKVDVKGTKRNPTLLSDIICSTNLLGKMEVLFAGASQKRGQNLVSSLRAYQSECSAFHSRYQRVKRRKYKGKGRADDAVEIDAHAQDIRIHKMALVTQVHDLFPHLGTGYIAKLLDHYGDNVETVVSHLLEDSLAPQLQDLNVSEELQQPHGTSSSPHSHLAPKPTPPLPPSIPPSQPQSQPQPQAHSTIPQRKNIFDNADLTRHTTPAGSLRYGRANPHQTADDLLSQKPTRANKAAILSALAAFDSDDDERDDTYDMADVGGTVDAVVPGADVDADAIANADRRPATAFAYADIDQALYTHYTTTPSLFARDAGTRRSAPRAQLREETGMTDEAIEGWAVMLARDPKRLARMERSFTLGAGGGGLNRQPELAATAYRRREGGESGTGTEGEETDGGGRGGGGGGGGGGGRGRGGRGHGRGGGGGRGGRGGGANVAGPSGERDTAMARRRKDASKGSRANHNRRDQRAKKMARGGL
ncbi:CUE domain-containing protein [Blastomyces gilchristii SLH14081]|uniref:CUE domain-containing protein n=1 Tax=Blastomyces gilchristii (strain SLH14081) TaxID=559298 RepID=A0A179UMJ5_BLAGS|nr:CUE domain-containing protein [Blastomyces gilchristii SLH14081]OAT09305.1 CUE domain-containing protein [Blastomyces gilchristii SLH14081]